MQQKGEDRRIERALDVLSAIVEIQEEQLQELSRRPAAIQTAFGLATETKGLARAALRDLRIAQRQIGA